MAESGQLQQTDFFDNVGGVNLVDTAFRIKDNQAAGGFNFDYHVTGGIRKRYGPSKINTSADSQLKSLGFGLFAPASGASKTVLRVAGTKLQAVDTTAATFTALSEDKAAAGSTPFSSSSTQTAQFSQFNNGVADILWAVGAGATLPIGAYSSTKYTTNGMAVPAGSITATRATGGVTGGWATTGTYYYAVVYRKASTQAFSNATLDVSATVTATDDKVTVSLAGLTGLDTTLVDQIYIYRSSVSGSSGFTAGSLIAQVASTTASFVDKGPVGNPDIASSQTVPRAASIILDNAVLPSGTYNVMTMFKRRLVVAQNSTLYLSEVNKSESWPATNVITVPSVGPITGLAVISFTSPQAQTLDELLVIFKERELWVVSGSAYQSDSTGNTGWALKFIDQVGCPDQSLVVLANGFLAWIDFRGIYLWDGTSKPIYCSRLLEPLFGRDGDLNKSKLSIGCGEFYRKENQIVWYLSHKLYGDQKFSIKLDLRLTLPSIEQELVGRNIDAVLMQDTLTQPVYAALSYIPYGGSEEMMILGDASGYCYFAANSYGDASSDFSFTYLTKAINCGDPNTLKQFHRVIVWVQDYGTWNLTLDYWSNYRNGSTYQSSQTLPISTATAPVAPALWDFAYWDTSSYDTFPNTTGVLPLIFNLNAGIANSNIGTALQLQFRNETQNQPITIHGFSVQWSALGGIN